MEKYMPKSNEILEMFNEYCDKFQTIAQQDVSTFDKQYNGLKRLVVSEEVCSGSDMHLGYYNPSPVEDIVIGNVHRGKILKKTTARTKITHKYGFDCNGKLLIIQDYINNENIIVDYQDKTVMYIGIRDEFGNKYVSSIAECKYDQHQRISQYTSGSILYYRCNEINQQIYKYSDLGVETVEFRSGMLTAIKLSEIYAPVWNSGNCDYYKNSKRENNKIEDCILNSLEYKLHHDKDGYITGYQLVSGDLKTNLFNCPQGVKRKV
jgi:trehalose/maltose hydrolase-like predicted phosphorylase